MPEAIRVLDNLTVSSEAIEEVAADLDEPYGIVEDHTYDGRYFLVEWVEEEGPETIGEHIASEFGGVNPDDIEFDPTDPGPVSRVSKAPRCPQDIDREEVTDE